MILDGVKKIYFIGIGGIGMSAVAGIAKARGFEVSGSDASDVYEPALGILKKYQIPFMIGYKAENFSGADLVVTTAAVDDSNPEVAKAVEAEAKIVSYPELLGELIQDKKRLVVVGTHGKGTTSGLLGYVLKELRDDSFFVGAVLTDLNTNFHYGKGDLIVVEGDEYKSSHDNLLPKFYYYKPDILLINNLEFDHPDMYPDLNAVKKVFAELAESVPTNGKIIYNADDKNVVDVVKNASAEKIGFGFQNLEAGIKATQPVLVGGFFETRIHANELDFAVQGILPGDLYAHNYLSASATLLALGISPDQFVSLFKKYSGVKRRYEIIFDQGITIIDDYAHHPTAVKNTIDATRAKYPNRRIVCFFEPHTFSRTKETLSELKDAFGGADLIYLAEVYPAREQKLMTSITGQEVVDTVKEAHPELSDRIIYVKDKNDALEKFKNEVKEGDVLVVMAVGSFNTLVYDLMQVYKDKK